MRFFWSICLLFTLNTNFLLIVTYLCNTNVLVCVVVIMMCLLLCCRRERHDIPLIVETCVEEVERRGEYIHKP